MSATDKIGLRIAITFVSFALLPVFAATSSLARSTSHPEPALPAGSATLALAVNVSNGPLCTAITQSSKSSYSFAVVPGTASGDSCPAETTSNGSTTITALGWVANNSGFAGLSYEKSMLESRLLDSSDTSMVALFNLLYAPNTGGVLRIGGGSVDTTLWDAAGPGETAGYIAPSDVQALAGFLQATGWKVIYGIDLDDLNTTPALAAAEAQYVAAQLGSNLLAFEIGNEPNAYSNISPWNFSAYLSRYKSYASAIQAAVPLAALVGPEVTQRNGSWSLSFGEAKVPNVVNLTEHYYIGSPAATPAPTVNDLITYPDTQLQGVLAQLEFAGYTTNTPWRIDETGSYFGGGLSGVSNAYASTLWTIDDLFTLAQFGGVSGNFHGGRTVSYSPIYNKGNSVYSVQPGFYGLYFSTLMGTGAMQAVSISGNASNVNVSAYAVGSNVLINNKSPQTLSIALTPAQMISTGNLQILSNANLPNVTTLTSAQETAVLSETSGVTIQGSAIGTDGSFTPNAPYTLTATGNVVTFTVPPLSAALVTLQ